MPVLKRIWMATCALLLTAMTPLVAAAQTLDAVPQIGPGPLFATLGALGLGTIITLKARDATGNKKTFALDTDKAQEAAETIDQYAELRAEETAGPLREALEAAKKQLTGYRDIIVGEILRIKALSALKSEGGEAKFDAETEKAYLEGLEAGRLKMEFDRLPNAETLSVKPATVNEPPADPTDPYAALATTALPAGGAS